MPSCYNEQSAKLTSESVGQNIVQKFAIFVSNHMGGPVGDPDEMLVAWMRAYPRWRLKFSIPEWVSTVSIINSWLSDAMLYELWADLDGSVAQKIYYSDLPWQIGKLLSLKQVHNVKQLLGISKDTRPFIGRVREARSLWTVYAKGRELEPHRLHLKMLSYKIQVWEQHLAKQTKENSDLLMKIDNLENVFADEGKRATFGKWNAFDKEDCDFGSKIDDSKAKKDQFLKEINHLRTQLDNLKGKRVKTKFDNSSILGKPPLLNNERDQLLKQIAFLKSKLASQDIRSCQKEYHELRTSYNALKVKFDSLNRKKWNINVSKSSKPKESVSEKVHTGESSKPFSRRVSQFTTYSLQKDRKFSKKSQHFETFFPQKGFKTRASNAKNQSFETSHSCFTPVKQVWRPIKESQTFEASTSQKSFKTSTLKGKNQVFVTPPSRFTPVKQVWRPKQSHSKSFKYSKSEMLSMQNKNDSASTINKKGRFSNDAKTNFRNVSSNDNNKWKSSSSTRFKTLHETPSFNNQWKIKRNFKSPLIPRELFSNATPVSSSRWNSTSLHRIDTTFKWFSKLGRPVSTVLKWVLKRVKFTTEATIIRTDATKAWQTHHRCSGAAAAPSTLKCSTNVATSTRRCSVGKLQSQDVQINPVQVVDDSLIISRSSWIESENNDALSKSVNETQLQQHESLVTKSTTLEANLNTDVKALDVGSVITESSGTKSNKHDTRSSSWTYITHAVDAYIKPVNDQVPFAKVQLTAQHNALANEQQHTEQSEPIYDTYMWEKVESNTTPDSTNMCHRGGEIDQDAEQYRSKKVPFLKG
ncbi:hypothetical protein Tco_0547820 [Tanacetum coccineum]